MINNNRLLNADGTQRDPVWELAKSDIMMFGKIFCPKHFGKESPRFHLELMLAAMLNQFCAIAAPRESAKSTYISFLLPFYNIIFRIEPFIVLISNTFKKAAMYLDTIKNELSENELIRKFPPIELVRDAEGDTIFRHYNGFKTMFLCKGVDQIGSLRGVKFGASRPGLIILDDVEDDELVRNPDRRKILKEEFDEVLGRCGHDKTKIVVIGTILHDDSQLAKLVSRDHYPRYKKVIYRAHINPDTQNERSLWPEKWSLEELRRLRRDEPNVYAKEMQNDPVAGSNTRFQRSDFRYWKEANGRILTMDADGHVEKSYDFRECRAAISCDLAWKEKRTSDSSVIMPGLLSPNSEILVYDYVAKKGMRPDETAEHLFTMVERLEAATGSVVPVGFEKAMLENVTQWLLRREMKLRNKFLLTKELVWDNDKNTRIETRLQPRYAQHVIYHKHGMGDLEHQLERFPFGAFDDIVDALQGLVQLLQNPKHASDVPKDTDAFNWWRTRAIEARTVPKNKPRLTGHKRYSKYFQLPSKLSWR